MESLTFWGSLERKAYFSWMNLTYGGLCSLHVWWSLILSSPLLTFTVLMQQLCMEETFLRIEIPLLLALTPLSASSDPPPTSLLWSSLQPPALCLCHMAAPLLGCLAWKLLPQSFLAPMFDLTYALSRSAWDLTSREHNLDHRETGSSGSILLPSSVFWNENAK